MKYFPKLLWAWTIFSLILTWTPGKVLPKPEFFQLDLFEFFAHFIIFLVFSFLLTGAIVELKRLLRITNKLFFLVLVLSLAFSIITEAGQIFIPGRYFSEFDLIMNLFGTLCGIGLFFLKFKYFPK